MSRDPLQTVTLPLLVDAKHLETTERGCAEGECSVSTSRGHKMQKVRAVSAKSLVKWLNGDKRAGAVALRGLGLMRRALLAGSVNDLAAAIDQSRPVLLHPVSGKDTEVWTGDKIWAAAKWFYSEAINHAIKDAQWVAWWPFSNTRGVSPGVYCPNMGTAVAMALFMESVRVCPKCGIPFVPKQLNVEYCKPEHGVSYRTARSRDKKRMALKHGKSKERTR